MLDEALARMGSDTCIASLPTLVDEIADEVADGDAERAAVRTALRERLGLHVAS